MTEPVSPTSGPPPKKPRRPSNLPPGLVLSVPRAGRELGVSRKTIDRLISQGLLPARRLGGKTVILRRELEQFLAGLPVIATVDAALTRAAAHDRANGRLHEDIAR